ncbi:hypothetical protein [Prosthecobacter sp.]|uniref:hypothetical protein n=1 Tax=Prosthecobacter sp. TaxID=1965333 RepID=UPI002AB9B6A3|nr:hypothetical protein [Prosthecobacter sp.]MDZ4404258.1 hypothetical protein [Prosthecobacter sp.]
MKPKSTRRAILALLCLSTMLRAEAPPAGLRILTAGHSFHVWLPGLLIEATKNAGITGHTQVGLSSIGGSRTIQHWDAQGDKQKIKPVLMEGKADVLTLSPIFLPDAGIENFVKLGLEHNPKMRITVQEFWMTYDDQALWGPGKQRGPVDRDSKTMADLHVAHDDYFKSMDDHVRELNAKYAKDKPAVFVVPIGQAVMELRRLIIEGKAPGIAKQSDLFTDAIGHPRDHVKAIATYCHFAVIYGRSPVGLPMPAAIAKLPEAEKLNALLQKLSWDAVTQHPLSGVKAR